MGRTMDPYTLIDRVLKALDGSPPFPGFSSVITECFE